MKESLIKVEGLCKSYRVAHKQPGLTGTIRHFIQRKYQDILAVSNLSFSINQGEIVGFLGANGAGKTTTLKMLCGLIHPSSGLIRVAGYQPQRRQNTFLQKITLVMGQKQQLMWDLPALDSLRVNAAVYGISDRLVQKRIKILAEMLELGEELNRPVRKLSLGQRMKAELLAALLHEPEVLFLDEPTLGLDINAQTRVRQFLVDYNKRTGATILLTSHYMVDITSLCQRVLLIHQGSLFHDGPLETLSNQLASERRIKIELDRNTPKEAFFGLGRLESMSNRNIILIVHRDQLQRTLYEILDRFTILDLEVTNPPIDRLIGEIFQKGRI